MIKITYETFDFIGATSKVSKKMWKAGKNVYKKLTLCQYCFFKLVNYRQFKKCELSTMYMKKISILDF